MYVTDSGKKVVWTVNGVDFPFIQVPRIGLVQETPMRQDQYFALTGEKPSNFQGANLPVEQVNWFEATEAGKILSAKTGVPGFRLPTEHEWEWAAVGDTGYEWATDRPMSEDELLQAGACLMKKSGTCPVDRQDALKNIWGLSDMTGNVWEWTSSLHHAPESRVYRGGGWRYGPSHARVAGRDHYRPTPDFRIFDIGFRLCNDLRFLPWLQAYGVIPSFPVPEMSASQIRDWCKS